jgi:hypothetical protein
MDTTATRAASAMAAAALGFGFVAAPAGRGGSQPWRSRGELLAAMCLAAVFGDSGQSRVLLYDALAKAMATEEDRRQIASALDDIQAIIARNSPYADLGPARHRLFALRAVLNADDDLRIRVERAEICSRQADAMMTPDGRCTDEAHRWDALSEALQQRESLVVVCPRPGRDGRAAGCATLALDFHKVAQVTAHAPAAEAAHAEAARFSVLPGERFRLTESAKRMHRAKYEHSAAAISSIAGEMASIIAAHPAYQKAELVVVVPGRKHDCSVRLGTEVADLTGKACVTLARQNEGDGPPDYLLLQPDLVRDREIILVDDVYRTGDTFRDAAQVLRGAGARHVLGLTVTCTVSAQIPP